MSWLNDRKDLAAVRVEIVLAVIGVAVLLLSGCAGLQPSRPEPAAQVPPQTTAQEVVVAKPATRPQVTPEPLPEPPARPPAPPVNDTVLALLSDADALASAGNLDAAAANLERAIRIDPRNAWLWNRLAHIRLKQGRYAQAASLAAKSSSLAAGDSALLNDNRAIIGQARMLRR